MTNYKPGLIAFSVAPDVAVVAAVAQLQPRLRRLAERLVAEAAVVVAVVSRPKVANELPPPRARVGLGKGRAAVKVEEAARARPRKVAGAKVELLPPDAGNCRK